MTTRALDIRMGPALDGIHRGPSYAGGMVENRPRAPANQMSRRRESTFAIAPSFSSSFRFVAEPPAPP